MTVVVPTNVAIFATHGWTCAIKFRHQGRRTRPQTNINRSVASRKKEHRVVVLAAQQFILRARLCLVCRQPWTDFAVLLAMPPGTS